jgi:phosphopantothenoylcysteine synthetase/decarboxylase
VTEKHLNLVVCGAGPAADAGILIQLAQEQSWTVTVTATQAALSFIDLMELEQLTGVSVRTGYGQSQGSQRDIRPVDALIIAPATYNTINKLASGIADTYVLTSVAEVLGRRAPAVVVPFVNAALASRHPFQSSVARLRAEGVRVIQGSDDDWEPHTPGFGDRQRAEFPWPTALEAITRSWQQ